MDDVVLGVLTWLAIITLLGVWAFLILAAFGIVEVGPLHVVVHNQ